MVDFGALKDRSRARWPWLDLVLSVQERFGAIGGGPLSSSITLATFVSLFPLLLVVIAVVGFLSAGRADFTSSVISNLGLTGDAAKQVEDAIAIAEDSRRAASIIGLLGLLWAGLGVVGAMETAFNAAWQVTGRGLIDKVVSLRWLLGAGTLFLVTAALGPALSWLPGPLIVLNVATGAALTTVLFLWTYSTLGNRSVGWRTHLPGALLVAVGFEVLKAVAGVYIPHAVAGSSTMYGSIGIVFVTLAWLAFYARLVVYGAVVNVVRYEAAAGTVTVEIEVPRIDGEVPLTATRGGAVADRAPLPD
jgi:membrane protein